MSWDLCRRAALAPLLLLVIACGSDAAPSVKSEPRAAADQGGTGGDKASRTEFPSAAATATLHGVVTFDGELPEPRKLPISADPFCEQCYADSGLPIKEEYQIDRQTRGIAHAFVKVVGAEDRWKFEVPDEPVLLNQVDCRYVPHTFGIMVGQKLVVTSSDDTQHNVHFFGRFNRLRSDNFTQLKGQKDELVFKRPETAQFRCDIHPWMKANVHVMRHPLFTTTSENGEFTLPKLPAGEYEIEVVHSKWKGSKKKIRVGDGETAKVELTVTGS